MLELIVVVAVLADRERIDIDLRNGIIPYGPGGTGERGQTYQSESVQTTLWTTDERVLMEIHDDGGGFEMGKMSSAIGHGAANIQTRVHAVRVMQI